MIIWIVVGFLAVFIGYKLFFSAERNSQATPANALNTNPEAKPTSEPKPAAATPLAPLPPVANTISKAADARLVADAPVAAGPALIMGFLAQSISKINPEAGYFAPDTFQARIDEYKAQVSQAATLITYFGVDAFTSPDYQLVCNQYIFAVVGSFIQDAYHFKQQVTKSDQVSALEEVKVSMNKLRGLLYTLHRDLKPSENALQASDIVTAILDDASREADEKIRQVNATTLGGKVSPASEQLFNLGFYLLNSSNLFVLPNQPVTKGFFDFKTAFFPTFDAIKWQDYVVAKTLFDLSLKADPSNVLAAIYREVARLNAAMRNEYADYDREEIISHLKAIVAKYPRHALGHIELAHAHASVSEDALAEQHTELALAIDRDSVYLQYSAMLVYRNLYEREKEAKLRGSLSLDADDTNNPRVYYMAAVGLTEPQTLLMAFMQIEKAVQYGKSKDYYWLRNQILRYLKNQLSDKEYESLRGEELTCQGEVEVKLLKEREDKFTMDGADFSTVLSLAFSPDYAYVDVLEKDAALPLRYQLAEKQASIVLLDFNLTLAELASLKKFIFPSIPSILISGEYYLENEGPALTGNIYLKGLNIESLFNISR